jgi:predicted Zn-dependent protease
MFLICALGITTASQTPSERASTLKRSPTMTTQDALALAQKGRCTEALPVLRAWVPQISPKSARISAAMAQARCGMSVNDGEAVLSALALMRRDAPHDPDVLYISARYLSQLANRSAQELVATAPTSIQAQKLQAETLEAQGKSDEALTAYRHILEADPKAQEIHFRIGQILLNSSSPNPEQAQQEFEAELKNNPTNAAAEFMLGELARRNGQLEPAIGHFHQAAELDAGFLEAYLALGMSLNSAGKFAEAVVPLERYVKLEPSDPAGHYQLAMAYARTGKKEAAARESELQRKLAERTTQNIH